MKRIILSTACALTLMGASAGTSFAASNNHVAPGIPGTPNCRGQSIAYLAQDFNVAGAHGIGGIANAFDASVQDIQAIVDSYCSQV